MHKHSQKAILIGPSQQNEVGARKVPEPFISGLSRKILLVDDLVVRISEG